MLRLPPDPRPSLLTRAALWFAAALLLAPAVRSQVDVVSPGVGALGTTVTITGEGFGDAKGRAWFRSPGSTRRYALKVASWSDTQIVAEVRRAKYGDQVLIVRPKGKGMNDLEQGAAFTLATFEAEQVLPEAATPGMEVVLRGPYLGVRRPRVRIGLWPARVKGFEPVVEAVSDGGPPVGELTIVVPKSLSDNVYDIELHTPAGRSWDELRLEVLDSPVESMKPIVWATLGGKLLRARGPWTAYEEGDALCPDDVSGPCTILGAAKSANRVLGMLVAGYSASIDGVKAFEPGSVVLAVLRGKTSWAGLADAAGVTSARQTCPNCFLVSGYFSGIVERIEGSSEPYAFAVERGRFYDM